MYLFIQIWFFSYDEQALYYFPSEGVGFTENNIPFKFVFWTGGDVSSWYGVVFSDLMFILSHIEIRLVSPMYILRDKQHSICVGFYF